MRALQNFGHASGFISSLAVIPLTVPRPGLKTLGLFWIVLRDWEATHCGRSVSDKRMLQMFVQSSLFPDSQSLPKRDGLKPSTTRSGTKLGLLFVCVTLQNRRKRCLPRNIGPFAPGSD